MKDYMVTTIFFMKLIFSVAVLFFGCGSSLPHIRDVTELAPPLNVRMTRENSHIKISWDPSPDENQSQFDGYNIYYSKKSLILASVKALPRPLIVYRSQHDVILQDLNSASQYFVHVRSKDKDGNLSFPSLPELVIKSTFFF